MKKDYLSPAIIAVELQAESVIYSSPQLGNPGSAGYYPGYNDQGEY